MNTGSRDELQMLSNIDRLAKAAERTAGALERIAKLAPDERHVFIVRPPDPSEATAVFAREQDADAFARTFLDPAGPEWQYPEVERAAVCDGELATQMIQQRSAPAGA